MEPWFFRDADRFYRERQDLDALGQRCEWLVGHEWRLTDAGLCVDAVVRAHSYDYELRVAFPSIFPDAPAVVRPTNAQNRLSQHQYGGPDGPLCLQWGPDNWHREVTAANLLESAHELLETENPLGRSRDAVPTVAPSRHYLTVGQDIRSEWARWYLTPAFSEYLHQQQPSTIGWFRFSFRDLTENQWVALVHEAGPLNGDRWADASLPINLPGAKEADLLAGAWFQVDASPAEITELHQVSELALLMPSGAAPNLLAMDGTSAIDGMQRWLAGAIVRDREAQLHLVMFFANGQLFHATRLESVVIAANGRTPDAATLSDKTIGLVGAGSAGSKIAVTLARMGVRNFYVVDHDIFLPENIERHALDWQSVGLHKVDALAKSLRWIAPSIAVDVSRLHLTGQESSAAVAGVLSRLAKCDLIVDATADARAFNLLAAVGRAAKRPFVWLEVFGGGLGGLLGRSRPESDPPAQDMRLVYLRYCEENPAPEAIRTAVRYELQDQDGPPVVASDADVAIIAHHAARLAVDSLAPANQSKYSFSLYLLGLTPGWVFREAFETMPLVTGSPQHDEVSETTAQHVGENIAFLSGLLPNKR
jgi:sulfur-carrier protein adenylyltransferase/sulfurtransferase